jgi:exosome complex component RRP42
LFDFYLGPKIGTNYVVDCLMEEEMCMTARVTVAVNKSGNICTLQKGGRGGLEPTYMLQMIQAACKLGQQMILKLDEALAQEKAAEGKKVQKKGFFQ